MTESPNLTLKQKTLDFLRFRKACYINVFAKNLASETVLTDLATFCRASTTPFDKDPYITARLLGRKEVWLRIAQHLGYTEEELYRVFALGKLAHSQTEEEE